MPVAIFNPKRSPCLALLSGAIFGVMCASPKEPPPSIAISISTPKSEVQPSQAVNVEVAVTNMSKSGIVLPYGQNAVAAGFRFHVVDDVGKQPKITKYYWDVTGRKEPKEDVKDLNREYVVIGDSFMIPSKAPPPVEPGHDVKYTANVNGLYDLSSPGQYTIQVSGTDPVTHETVESNKITVTVTK